MDQISWEPTITTIIAFLVTALLAFVKGIVVSGGSVTQLRADYEARLKDSYERIEKANLNADRWMEIAMRSTGAAKDLIAVAKSRDIRENRDSEERERGR